MFKEGLSAERVEIGGEQREFRENSQRIENSYRVIFSEFVE